VGEREEANAHFQKKKKRARPVYRKRNLIKEKTRGGKRRRTLRVKRRERRPKKKKIENPSSRKETVKGKKVASK